ncbi:RDD family protein [Parafilimonas sp.]|uniref:RDD family protein n=1 Tax=Parafilimonas sp. TaxID=1969739 RepID=UPI0039E57C93
MEKIKIPTSFNIELDYETPAFHKRFFAWVIDGCVLTAYYLIALNIIRAISLAHTTAGSDLPFLYNMSAVQLLFFLPIVLYHLVFEVAMNGQSIGKKLMNIQVIGEDGGRPALHQYLIRWLTRPFDLGLTLGLAGLLTTVLTKKNQRLGDMAAGTLVIKTKMETDINDTVFLELEEEYKPRFPQVMRLSDRDMNTIKGVLNNSMRFKNFDVAARLSDKIRTVLGITDQTEPAAFLEILLKDYNYYSNREE